MENQEDSIENLTDAEMKFPSLRLQCLIYLLKPMRANIAFHAANYGDPKVISRRGRLVQSFLNPYYLTNNRVKINLLPHDRSELIEPLRQSNQQSKSKGIILYFHGGAFLVGSPKTVRPITSNLVAKSNHEVVCYSARYPLNQPYQTTLKYANNLYSTLRERWNPNQIILAGDSAGAHLALSIALGEAETKEKSQKPAGVLLFSPWIDLSSETTIDDPLIYAKSAKHVSNLLLSKDIKKIKGHKLPIKAPPPLHDHPELENLPPLYLQYGTNELVSNESRKFGEKAKTANISIEIDEVDHGFHGFHYFGDKLPESDQALERAANFVDKLLLDLNNN